MHVVKQQKVIPAARLEQLNHLARNIYIAHGEYVSELYDFSNAMTPLGKRCWNSAVISYYNCIIKDFDENEVAELLFP